MGQKTNPLGFRVGIMSDAFSRWNATSQADFASFVIEDENIRRFLEKRLRAAALSHVHIERSGQKLVISVHVARPHMVIGRKGSSIEEIVKDLSKLTKLQPSFNVEEVKRPDLSAKITAEAVAQELEQRGSFRRLLKKYSSAAMASGAHGVKIMVSGRVGGAEIARVEKISQGSVPLHTLRADIDFATARAQTTYGTIGVKVWIHKGQFQFQNPTQNYAPQKGGRRVQQKG